MSARRFVAVAAAVEIDGLFYFFLFLSLSLVPTKKKLSHLADDVEHGHKRDEADGHHDDERLSFFFRRRARG